MTAKGSENAPISLFIRLGAKDVTASSCAPRRARLGQLREPTLVGSGGSRLFNLRFLEDDVLAGDRIKFLEFELIGFAARVFLCDIEKPSVGAADKFDQYSIRLSHMTTLASGVAWTGR